MAEEAVKENSVQIEPAQKQEEKVTEVKSGRVGLYDNFRGIAVILYVISMMSNIRKSFALPFWFIHTEADAALAATQRLFVFWNITLADLGPVFF